MKSFLQEAVKNNTIIVIVAQMADPIGRGKAAPSFLVIFKLVDGVYK